MTTKHYDAATFNSRQSIGYLLKMAHMQLQDCANDVLAPHDISFVQWLVMLKLREGVASTASDLCRAMRHDNGALTRVLDQLEERGYLTRHRSVQDRRVVELQLTAAGSEQLDVLLPALMDRLNLVLGDFSTAEFAELTHLLNKLMACLGDHAAGSQTSP
ncbi:MAG: MarR family transcriptional regulator [Halioglobus sp.]